MQKIYTVHYPEEDRTLYCVRPAPFHGWKEIDISDAPVEVAKFLADSKENISDPWSASEEPDGTFHFYNKAC